MQKSTHVRTSVASAIAIGFVGLLISVVGLEASLLRYSDIHWLFWIANLTLFTGLFLTATAHANEELSRTYENTPVQ